MLLASSLRLLACQQSLGQGVAVRGLDHGLRELEQGLRGLATEPASQIPKRPANPWQAFFASKLPEYRKKSPGAKVPELMKTISKEWAAVPQAQKAPMAAVFQKETEKWRKRMEDVPDDVMETVKSENRVKSVAKKTKTAVVELKTLLDKLGKPHKPSPSYILFASERRAALPLKPGQSFVGSSKVIGKEWNEMSDEKKEVYIRKYKGLKADYDKALTKWSSKMEKLGKMDEIRKAEAKVSALQRELTAAKEM